jgi:hypothetical protein
MKITVILKTCQGCRHIDHSGAFTVRGARRICGHPDASGIKRVTLEEYYAEYPEYILTRSHTHFEYHWIHRVLTKNSDEKVKRIPKWCPLKHSSKY